MHHKRPAGALLALIFLAACSSTSGPTGSADRSRTPVAATPGGVTFTAAPDPTASAAPGEPGSSDQPDPGTIYTVQPGDSLSSIARAFGATVSQLQAWNADRYPSMASNPNVIEPGWELAVSGDPGVTPMPTPSPAPATPRPTPQPTGSGCTAGDRLAGAPAQTYRTIPGAGPGVALTFDMGGRMDPAVDILNFLVENEVCATLFPTGVMTQTSFGQAAMAIVRDHPELFEIGNHTMFHCDLVRGGGGSPTTAPCSGGPFSADRIRKELADAEAILRDATGQNPQPYWRPPYGSISDGVLNAAASAGYTQTFLWDIDSIDWKPMSDGGPSAEQIAAKIVNNAVNGSNVLFHLGGYETLGALRLIVPALRDRGFTLTSLSDLLN